LAVRDRGRILVIRAADVDWLESADNYVTLHVERRTYLIRQTMKVLEAKLDPARFLRIRRSAMVNVDRVVELIPEAHGEHLVRLRDGTELSSTRTYADALRDFLARLG
jgi:two-component system LytT family response regulator